jgi:hypothetical protein
MKFYAALCFLILAFLHTSIAQIDLQPVWEVDLKRPIGQFRAVPVSLGPDKPACMAALYSEDAEVDPYIGMFFFPRHTLKLVLLDENGNLVWHRDLGPGMVPGVWFSPICAFDLDLDGRDEIWIIGNTDPEHPLDYRRYVLQKLDPETGEILGQWPWKPPVEPQSMSHTYRHFIMGAYVRDQPILITAQGTYGPMAIQAWNPDMSLRWEHLIAEGAPGSLGSHVTPVVDLNHDGVDELLWGERCIELDRGTELFCADRDSWQGHSDIVQPVLDYSANRWYIFTCRESMERVGPRIVMFDDRGERIWADLDSGHIDTGWAARLGANGEPVVLGVKVGAKVRTAEGERRTGVVEHIYEAFSGKRSESGFSVYTSIPVDLDGDGRHELVRGYFEGDGEVLDRHGRRLGNIGGLAAMASKFTALPGEQILSYSKDGKIRLWADRNAADRPEALRRYAHPFYRINRRQTGNGYNLFTLGGI